MAASGKRGIFHKAGFVSILFGVLATCQVAAQEPGVQTVAQGLQTPWSLAFLSNGRMLVTERAGRLRMIDSDGSLSKPVGGVPEVHACGQGGLLDVIVSPDFEHDATIFFSYAEPIGNGARTAVAQARLDVENLHLEDVRRIFAQQDDLPGGHHFGSRLAVAPDGTLFVT